MTQGTSDKSAMLHAYCGTWQGMTRTWLEPDKLADESPWHATIRPILAGRYVQYEYTGTLQGEPLEGRAIIGYHTGTGQFEMAWIDTFHQSAGIMHCKGGEIATGFSVLGSYRVDEIGTEWGWRTAFEMIEPEHLTVRAYNIPFQGTEALALETIYTRV